VHSNALPSGVLVRVRNGRLLRYIEAPWEVPPSTGSPLRAVMIGPGHPPAVEDDVRDLLLQCGLHDVRIRRSDIPLRF
jgi:hypothetical protein